MIFLRSLLFNVAFYLCTAVFAIGGLPTMLFGRKAILELARAWARASLWLLDLICGVKVEYRGVENIQPQGCIIASKHQSALETLALVTQVKDFTYILKRELTFIPLFGQYLVLSNQIAINRASRSAAMSRLVDARGQGDRGGARHFHLSRRHAPPGRRDAALQERGQPSLCRRPCALRAGGARTPACSGRAAPCGAIPEPV